MRKRIKDWIGPWVQAILLVVVFVMPIIFNGCYWINRIFDSQSLNFENIKFYFLMQFGNVAIGAFFAFLLILKLRQANEKKVLNTGKEYHQHSYVGYILCSSVLGYKKCRLIRVPIAMQFKLIIRDTFSEYDYGEDDDYQRIDNEYIRVQLPENYTSTVNIVLSDTYPINIEMLPASTSKLEIVWISRNNNSVDSSRCFSTKFCETVRNTIHYLPSNVNSVNLYSTLNPKHCYWIARNVFKMGGRSNIRTLYVFPQSYKNSSWNYDEKGIKIFTE